MMAQFRASVRLQRFEVLAAVLATMVLGGGALIVAAMLRLIGMSPECWAATFGDTGLSAPAAGACADPVHRFVELNETLGSRLIAAMAFLPLAIGLLLGVPTVSREIESGTAPTVWAVADSRTGWLVSRLVSIGGLALILLVLIGVASELLWQARAPTGIPNRFDDAGLHGIAVIAKGAAAVGLGALTGAIVGRTLPALIGATVATIVVIAIGAVIRGMFEGLAEAPADEFAGVLYDYAESGVSAIVAVASIVGTFLVVNRRRPT
jgi:hypothetical protein